MEKRNFDTDIASLVGEMKGWSWSRRSSSSLWHGLPDRATGPTEGLLGSGSLETLGRGSGEVRRPRHNKAAGPERRSSFYDTRRTWGPTTLRHNGAAVCTAPASRGARRRSGERMKAKRKISLLRTDCGCCKMANSSKPIRPTETRLTPFRRVAAGGDGQPGFRGYEIRYDREVARGPGPTFRKNPSFPLWRLLFRPRPRNVTFVPKASGSAASTAQAASLPTRFSCAIWEVGTVR